VGERVLETRIFLFGAHERGARYKSLGSPPPPPPPSLVDPHLGLWVPWQRLFSCARLFAAAAHGRDGRPCFAACACRRFVSCDL